MSILLGGSLSAILFGGLATLSAAAKATNTKIVVEPNIFRLFSSIGFPWLLTKTYDDVVMDMESLVELIDSREVPPYHEWELITPLKKNDPMRELASLLRENGLTRGESNVISLAAGSHYDRLFLLRPRARGVARSLKLSPSSPLVATTEALRRGIIDMDEFARLAWQLTSGMIKGGDNIWLKLD